MSRSVRTRTIRRVAASTLAGVMLAAVASAPAQAAAGTVSGLVGGPVNALGTRTYGPADPELSLAATQIGNDVQLAIGLDVGPYNAVAAYQAQAWQYEFDIVDGTTVVLSGDDCETSASLSPLVPVGASMPGIGGASPIPALICTVDDAAAGIHAYAIRNMNVNMSSPSSGSLAAPRSGFDVNVNRLASPWAGGGSSSNNYVPTDPAANWTVTETLVVNPVRTLSVLEVAGQVPGVAAVRTVTSGVSAPITLSGSGWTPDLASGQITADVCPVGGCSPAGAFPTSLTTTPDGQLAGSMTIPSSEMLQGTWLLTLSEPGGQASTPLLILGQPTIVVPPTVPFGSPVAVAGFNFDPQRPVDVFGCVVAVVGCAPTGPTSSTMVGPGGQFSLLDVDPGSWQTGALIAEQDNGESPAAWTRASAPIIVTTLATQTTLTAPAQVSWPADDVAVQVSVAGLPDTADGDVTVTAYGPDDPTCSGAPVGTDVQVLPPPAGGTASVLASVGLAGPGSYRWVASYEGSQDPSTSECGAPNATTEVTTLTGQLDVSLNSPEVELGSATVAGATLSGVDDSAGGSVEFAIFAGSACAGLPVFNGSAGPVSGSGTYSSPAFVPTTYGTYTWQVTYSGDANHAPLVLCDTVNARVDVVSLPAAPSSVVVAPSIVDGEPVNDQVTVTWDDSFAGGGLPIDAAVVRFYEPGTNTVWFSDFVLDGSESYTLAGFLPMAAYEVTVALQNALGESPEAPRQTITPNLTPLAPSITGFAQSGDGALTVRWVPGATAYPDQTYRLELNPGALVATSPAETGESEFTFNGLQNGVAYSVEVVAVPPPGAIAGVGDSAPASAGPVTVQAVPDPPASVTAVPRIGAVRLDWLAPVDDGGLPVTDYSVTNLSLGATEVVPATQLRYIWRNLVPGTPYIFELRAINALGASVPVVVGPVVPTEALPGAPTAVVGTADNPVASKSVAVSWTAPVDDGGAPIAYYQVQTYLNGTLLKQKATTGPVTTFTVDRLTNGQPYTFRVRARNTAGYWSEASVESAPVTPYELPGAPVTNPATAYNAAVKITWSPPTTDGGSPVSSYVVTLFDPSSTAVCTQGVSAAGPLEAVFRSDRPDGNCPALVNGTKYTLNVRSVNARGLSTNATGGRTVTPQSGRPSLVP